MAGSAILISSLTREKGRLIDDFMNFTHEAWFLSLYAMSCALN